MWTLLSQLILALFISRLHARQTLLLSSELANNNEVMCGHNIHSNCLIEASFASLASNDSVDVVVNCTDPAASLFNYNQFSNKIEKISWNGCLAVENLKYLGLRKIWNRKQVKALNIENFIAKSIEAGTFDGFSQLQRLSIGKNFIEKLSSSSFRGLESLLILRMIENDLKWMGAWTLSSVPKLNALKIVDRSLLMANNQFTVNQIADNVEMEIYFTEMDLMEHLFHHARNLSISLVLKDDFHGCVQASSYIYAISILKQRIFCD
jgi:Leucine rich repeat